MVLCMLMTSEYATVRKIREQSRDTSNKVLTELKIGPQTTASNFPSQKRSAFIFVNLEEFTMIQFFIYIDLQYLLLKNQNFLE